MFEFIQSIFLKHELTFLTGSCKVFFFHWKQRNIKGKHLTQTFGLIEIIYPLWKDFNISSKGCWTECWGMLTVPSLPLLLGPLVLLIGVKSLQHYDRPGTWSTALHTLTRGPGGAGTTQLWATQLWYFGQTLFLMNGGACLSNLNAVPDY